MRLRASNDAYFFGESTSKTFILDIDNNLNKLNVVPSDQCSQTNQGEVSYLSSVWWEEKSMSSVNTRCNYLLSLHSFQSERWAWLNEYNPLILFRALIRKPGNGQMRLDRCWESGLIFLIALCSLDTVPSQLLSINLTNG